MLNFVISKVQAKWCQLVTCCSRKKIEQASFSVFLWFPAYACLSARISSTTCFASSRTPGNSSVTLYTQCEANKVTSQKKWRLEKQKNNVFSILLQSPFPMFSWGSMRRLLHFHFSFWLLDNLLRLISLQVIAWRFFGLVRVASDVVWLFFSMHGKKAVPVLRFLWVILLFAILLVFIRWPSILQGAPVCMFATKNMPKVRRWQKPRQSNLPPF